MIRAAGVWNGERVRSPQILARPIAEGRQPLTKDRPHGFVTLHVNAANFTRAIVEIEIRVEFFVLRSCRQFWRRRRLAIRSSRRHYAWVAGLKVAKVLLHISSRTKQSFFFTSPQPDANRPFRFQAERLYDAHRFH